MVIQDDRPEPTTGHHLILGGGGFIGRHVALLLAQLGHRVTVAGRHPPGQPLPSAWTARVRWQSLELGSADWDALVADVDVVHHYAWSSIPASANANPGGDLFVNVSATIAMLDALNRRGGGRVVFASSGGTVYGKLRQTPVAEDHPLAPITAYGAGKATAELYLGLYRSLHGLDCRIARIANAYGAGQDPAQGLGAVTTFMECALRHEPITIWGTGEVVRDYIHIADVAKFLVRLANAPRQEDFVFNVGSGVGVSLNELVAELEARLQRSLSVTRSETRAFDVPISVLCIDRARAKLGWAPALSFSDGIARTLQDMSTAARFSTLD